MKKFACVLIVFVLLLSGCGLDPALIRQMPDENVVEYRDLRYFAKVMDHESYMNMCAYYEAALAFKEWCDLPYPTTQTAVENMVSVLRYECPELMMLDMTKAFEMMTVGETVIRVQICYSMTPNTYGAMDLQVRRQIKELAQQCEGLTDREKQKLIYEYITANCTYDDSADWAGTAFGCLIKGKAKCDGISSAMKWALEAAGVSCLTIAGMPVEGQIGHAWNVVCLDGSWYDLDVTADVSREEGIANCYAAYNVSDSWIREQYVLDPGFTAYGTLPGTPHMEDSYHALTGCYVPTGAADGLDARFIHAYENQGTFILQFEDKEEFEAFEEALDARLEVLGNQQGWSTWSWSTLSVPDYRTISITAGTE